MGGLYRGDTVIVTRDETVKQILLRPLKFKPGEKYHYSNPGYTLLGILVEMVSGQPYERFVNEQFFKPAGMTLTGYRLPKWDMSQLARDSSGDTDWGPAFDRVWGPDGPYWSLMGAGGILSTVGDMFKWELALQGDAILPASAKQKLFHPHVVSNERGGHYGYGWAISKTKRETTERWHTGGSMFGTRARHSRFVDDDVTVIILSNHNPVPGDEDGKLAERLADIVVAAKGGTD